MSSGLRVLAVMGNAKNQELIGRCLVNHGYRVMPASDLAAARSQVEASTPVDAAVVDLSGFSAEVWSFCELLRERSVPFMLLSPSSSAPIRREGRRRGADGVHVKPIAMQELVSVVSHLVGR